MIPHNPKLSKRFGERGIKLTERFKKITSRLPAAFHTIRMKMVVTVVTAMVLSALVASLISNLGTMFIEKVLLDEERMANNQIELLLSFADYVKENKIASYESDKFDAWLESHGNASLTVFRESEKVLGDDDADDKSTWYADDGSTTIVRESDFPFLSTTGGKVITTSGVKDGRVYSNYDFMVYPVRFSDGVRSVVIYNHIEQVYTTALSVITLLFYCLIMLLVILKYNGSLIKRIKSVSQQVSVVSKGNISSSVSMSGSDEISQLASDVEHMRGVLEERIISEQNAWKSNQELITSISHDIRTPLTTLIGYSDMLANGQYKDDEQFNRYLKSCREKAYQLKSLTDELFGYFLVFGSPEVKTSPETENARILLEQLLGEPLADLGARGCKVTEKNLREDVYISVDVMLLKRIFDNIFSNINKYADLEKPIKATAEKNGDFIEVDFKNYINKNNKHVESTKIGTKICKRLSEAMNITYSFKESGGIYETKLSLPIIKKEELNEEHS